jgi:uncharacterized membrane protein YfcA
MPTSLMLGLAVGLILALTGAGGGILVVVQADARFDGLFGG